MYIRHHGPHPTLCPRAGLGTEKIMILSLFALKPLIFIAKTWDHNNAFLIQFHKITAKNPPPPSQITTTSQKRRGATDAPPNS